MVRFNGLNNLILEREFLTCLLLATLVPFKTRWPPFFPPVRTLNVRLAWLTSCLRSWPCGIGLATALCLIRGSWYGIYRSKLLALLWATVLRWVPNYNVRKLQKTSAESSLTWLATSSRILRKNDLFFLVVLCRGRLGVVSVGSCAREKKWSRDVSRDVSRSSR